MYSLSLSFRISIVQNLTFTVISGTSRFICVYFKTIAIVVQLLSCIWLFATPWTTACQASLSITDSWSLLKVMSIESMMPSNHIILCCPFLFLNNNFMTFTITNEINVHTKISIRVKAAFSSQTHSLWYAFTYIMCKWSNNKDQFFSFSRLF